MKSRSVFIRLAQSFFFQAHAINFDFEKSIDFLNVAHRLSDMNQKVQESKIYYFQRIKVAG